MGWIFSTAPSFTMNTIIILISAFITSGLKYHFFTTSDTHHVGVVQAFLGTTGTFQQYGRRISVLVQRKYLPRPQLVLYDSTTTAGVSSEVEQFLQQEHSMFYALLLYKNEYVWKMIRDTQMNNGACTIFAPTNTALQALGEKKLQQLQDNRNEEVRNKIGSYHIVLDTNDPVVTVEQLYNCGGIRTIATGENPIVPVERNKRSGGNMFAMFMNNNDDDNGDGTVILGSNNARIVNSI